MGEREGGREGGGKNEQGSDRGRGVRGSEEAMEVRMKRGKNEEGRTVSVINVDGYVGEMLCISLQQSILAHSC